SGTPNIYVWNQADSSITQLTDVLGGVTSLSWSHSGERLVFSAFDRGGFDVFAVREGLSLDATLERLQQDSPQSVFKGDRIATAAPDSTPPPQPSMGALARGVWTDSLTTLPDSSLISGRTAGMLAARDTVEVFAQAQRGGDPEGHWYGGPGGYVGMGGMADT